MLLLQDDDSGLGDPTVLSVMDFVVSLGNSNEIDKQLLVSNGYHRSRIKRETLLKAGFSIEILEIAHLLP